MNINVTVNPAPSGGSGGGCGGGGTTIIESVVNATQIFCGDGICQERIEDPFTCTRDCQLTSQNILCTDPNKPCAFAQAWFIKYATYGVVGFFALFLIRRQYIKYQEK